MVNPLARVIMQKNLKDVKPIISSNVDYKTSNLDNRERETILDLIKGEREVVEGLKKNTAITLDEAASRIKNNR